MESEEVQTAVTLQRIVPLDLLGGGGISGLYTASYPKTKILKWWTLIVCEAVEETGISRDEVPVVMKMNQFRW